jgi:cobyrinic acid a,c-diamide synthase
MSRSFSAFVIAGTNSGVGKTTVTLGLLAALRCRKLKVQPFKVGPDFIDPGLHCEVAGTVSHNLDGWMLSRNYNLHTFRKNSHGRDVAVVEGGNGII